MATVWLRTNTRAIFLGMILPALALAVGLFVVYGVESLAGRVAGGLVAIVSGLLLILLAVQLRRPRLAHEPGYLLVYLRSWSPIRVPLEIVEGFLMGQGPSLLSGRQHEQTETVTLVIRLSDRAEEWSQVDVKPALGKWCDGYITIRGTWCEPLSVDLVNRLNAQLDEEAKASARAKVIA
jgi:hypothetical protein